MANERGQTLHERLPECQVEIDSMKEHIKESVPIRDSVKKSELLLCNIRPQLDRTERMAYESNNRSVQNDRRITDHRVKGWEPRIEKLEISVDKILKDIVPRFEYVEEWVKKQDAWHVKWLTVGMNIFQSILTVGLTILIFQRFPK